MKISIICIYNNRTVLEDCLLASLKNNDCELILVNNEENEFKCAADALNYGGKKASGDLLIFVHQDVEFYENNLKEIVRHCLKLDDLGVAGVAGADLSTGILKSNSLHGIPPIGISKNHINTPEPVQTLDELILIIPKKIFNKFKFDNETCDHWHLYGADYCLQTIKNNYTNYVLPVKLYHLSDGQSMSLDYYRTLKNVLNKYKNDFEYIHTICSGGHNPNNLHKVNILYYLEIIHIRRPLEIFLEKSGFLLKFLKIFLE